jgi:hypothetical protein
LQLTHSLHSLFDASCVLPFPRNCIKQDEDMELATDEVLATTEDVVATDDGLEEAVSSLAGPNSTQLEYPHAANMPTSRLAIASSALESPLMDCQQQYDEGSADDQQEGLAASADEEGLAAEQQDCSEPGSSHMQMADAAMMLAAAQAQGAAGLCSSSSGSYSQHTLLNASATGMQQPLAAGSRHVLLGAGSRLGHSPSLALALALHQQQQQVAMQQQYSACSSMQQQQPGSPVKAGNISLSAATASPVSHSSTHYFRTEQGSDAASYAASESAPGSPMMLGASSSCQVASNAAAAAARTHSNLGSLLSMQQPSQQMQQQYAAQQQQMQLQYMQLQQQQSLHGPSPLSLMGTADQQQAAPAATAMQQQLGSFGAMHSLSAVASQGDVMQLVRNMASALGGVGPAYNLLSAINNSRAAAAAAAMAGAQHADLQQ